MQVFYEARKPVLLFVSLNFATFCVQVMAVHHVNMSTCLIGYFPCNYGHVTCLYLADQKDRKTYFNASIKQRLQRLHRCTEIPIANVELNIVGMQAVLHMASQGSADHTIMHKGCFD